MSEFYNVTLTKEVIDDSEVSTSTGWSSQKTLDEIVNHRVTTFEGLSDVDVVNKKDKQMVIYSQDEGKFTTMDFQSMGDAAGLSLRQISKMGVTGTTTAPYILDIPINTVDFKVARVNLLKFQLGDQNVIKTLNSFSAGDSSDFVDDSVIIYDNTVHMNTSYNYKFVHEADLNQCTEYSCTIDKSNFKLVTALASTQSGTDRFINVTAVPKDRILTPKSDKDLSYVTNIDYFKLTATGNNIRVICSVDGGVTWNTFNADHWENIDFSIASIQAKGINTATFNAINSTYWNLINTNKKIRFAYLFSMDSISDTESIDDLSFQYDGQGKWVQAKEDTYDVAYASNTDLQISIKFSGDIKINY